MEEVPRHLKDKYHLTTLHDELKVRLSPPSVTMVSVLNPSICAFDDVMTGDT